MAHKSLNVIAPARIDEFGFDGRAIRWQFIDYRHIQIGKETHGQGAWYRRGRHHQLVHFCALVFQSQTLPHTKAVLLIHDDQAQVIKHHIVLKQGMRAHGYAYAAVCQTRFGGIFGLFAGAARDPCDLYAHGRKPLAEFLQVLLGQNFGRRHYCHLRSSLNRIECRQCRNNGFATAHIALQQAVHGIRLQHILLNFGQYFLLRAGQLKGQIRQQTRSPLPIALQYRRFATAALLMRELHRQLLRQQFIKFQALPRRQLAIVQLLGSVFWGGIVQ